MAFTVIPSPTDGARVGGTARVAVTVDVSVSIADRLRRTILGAGARVDGDLAGATLMDSSGLEAIPDVSGAVEPSGARAVLCNVSRQVRRIWENNGAGRTVKVGQ